VKSPSRVFLQLAHPPARGQRERPRPGNRRRP